MKKMEPAALNRRLFLVSLGSVSTLAACGGGGASSPFMPSKTPTPQPSPTATPTSTPTAPPGTVALTIVNQNSALDSTRLNIYIYGAQPGSNAKIWQYVNADGTATIMSAGGPAVPAISFLASGSQSSATSRTMYLPPMTSGRIYIVQGTLDIAIPSVAPAGAGPNPPTPWTSDGTQSLYFDFAEYTWNSTSDTLYLDTTQVDALGLALTGRLVGAQDQSMGYRSGALSQVKANIDALGAGSPWAACLTQWPYRVLNPQHVSFSDPTFLDAAIKAVWEAYKAPVWLAMNAVNADGYTTLYGQVDANDNFNFYTDTTGSTLVASILSPFSTSNQTAYTWGTATQQVLACNGAFVEFPATAAANQAAAANLGNMIAAALNRGVLGAAGSPLASEEVCTGFYGGAAYQNQYAAALHTVAKNATYGYGHAYAFSYDDQCNDSNTVTDPAPKSITLTINPS